MASRNIRRVSSVSSLSEFAVVTSISLRDHISESTENSREALTFDLNGDKMKRGRSPNPCTSPNISMTMKKSKTVTDFSVFHSVVESFDESQGFLKVVDDFKDFKLSSRGSEADRSSSFGSVDRTLSSIEQIERCDSLEDNFLRRPVARH